MTTLDTALTTLNDRTDRDIKVGADALISALRGGAMLQQIADPEGTVLDEVAVALADIDRRCEQLQQPILRGGPVGASGAVNKEEV